MKRALSAEPYLTPERPKKRRQISRPFPKPQPIPSKPKVLKSSPTTTFKLPQTPDLFRVCHSPSTSSFPALLSTPLPLYPSDSPNNPFGRRMVAAMHASLPDPSSYRMHLPLRFQFVRQGMQRPTGGIYRVVQVPRSYTFAHLKSLIAFLFGDLCGSQTAPRRKGHLFEVIKNAKQFSNALEGQMMRKGSIVCTQLSSDHDPFQYRGDAEVEDEELQQWYTDLAEGKTRSNFPPNEDTHWEEEEQFTVSNAWPHGNEISRGIKYYPVIGSPYVIHITIAKDEDVVRRKGNGNKPFVFKAQGRVRPWPLTGASAVYDLEEDFEEIDPEYDEDNPIEISVDEWNKQSFEKFYKRTVAPLPVLETPSQIPPTPDLTMSSSSSQGSSLGFSSSPDFNRSFSSDFDVSFSDSINFSPSSLPKVTPAPGVFSKHRLKNMRNRIERSKKKIRGPMWNGKDEEPPDMQETLMDKLPIDTPPPPKEKKKPRAASQEV